MSRFHCRISRRRWRFSSSGLIATRAIQNWLETSYLPHTELDRGLRNSIRTIFGYVGMIIATMAALSQLGFSLEKLTIVAGALSVGIGFGLRSIVENFVSGVDPSLGTPDPGR